METHNLFLNKAGRLRSGWRLGIFVVAFAVVAKLIEMALTVIVRLVLKGSAEGFLSSSAGFIVQALVLFAAAAIVGWGCGALLEDLPARALGWANHRGWLRDLGLGSIIGAVSVLFAALLGIAGRGLHFSLNAAATPSAIGKTLLFTAPLFVLAASGEEMLFRGYPLQTFTRARLTWLGIFLTSFPFAAAHLANPNVVRGVTFANTALAGVWLAAAYLRTRSLWLPLGIHWAWNWMMGAVLGLPVSGITRLAPASLLRVQDTGPAWLTGGAYGPEGGAICTIALLIAIVLVWRTSWLKPSEEMLKFTADEIREQKSEVGG
ncbi:MAG: protease family protein [Blastocatellia bacterium]|jgi:membrane protease YdiL (CAAX protease family)|nr:protease family protein [Blastocatellia bacterium]